jgi:hypothetical protein
MFAVPSVVSTLSTPVPTVTTHVIVTAELVFDQARSNGADSIGTTFVVITIATPCATVTTRRSIERHGSIVLHRGITSLTMIPGKYC